MLFEGVEINFCLFCFCTTCFRFVFFSNFLVDTTDARDLDPISGCTVLLNADDTNTFSFPSVIEGDSALAFLILVMWVLFLLLFTLTMLGNAFSLLFRIVFGSVTLFMGCVSRSLLSLPCRRQDGMTMSGFGQDLEGHPVEKCL